MGFLERVIVEKHAELERKKVLRPMAELERQLAELEKSPVRDFAAAVSGGDRFIAELKAKTPSIPSFVQSEHLDKIAPIYEKNGAAAISVVTDEKNFGTSLDTVTRVRKQVDLPILVKEFVIDPYQIVEARAAGADAILLIVRMLDWNGLTAMLDFAREIGIHTLVETHNEAEMKMALQAQAPIIGVNNRDLDRMEISLETTARVAALVPQEVTLVAESGIRTRADVEMLRGYGASAFLIGGTLLASEDPGATLRELTGVTRGTEKGGIE